MFVKLVAGASGDAPTTSTRIDLIHSVSDNDDNNNNNNRNSNSNKDDDHRRQSIQSESQFNSVPIRVCREANRRIDSL